MKKQYPVILLIGSLLIASCAPQPTETEPATSTDISAEGAPTEQAAATEPMAESGSEIVISASGACEVVSEEQVEAAFGRDVIEVNANTQTIGSGCEYVFDAESDTELQVSFYEGDTAKHYLAGLIAASEESCDAFFERLFDIAFGEDPDSGQDVSSQSFGDLYRGYIAIFEDCPAYVHSVDRPDVGSNVIATELIVFNWSSSVAVISEDRVVELTYQEPISAEAQAAFQGAMDRDSFYAVALPYADSILAGYTEILIELLVQAQ